MPRGDAVHTPTPAERRLVMLRCRVSGSAVPMRQWGCSKMTSPQFAGCRSWAGACARDQFCTGQVLLEQREAVWWTAVLPGAPGTVQVTPGVDPRVRGDDGTGARMTGCLRPCRWQQPLHRLPPHKTAEPAGGFCGGGHTGNRWVVVTQSNARAYVRRFAAMDRGAQCGFTPGLAPERLPPCLFSRRLVGGLDRRCKSEGACVQ